MRIVIQWEAAKKDYTVTEEFGIKHNLTETHNRWKNTQLYSWKHEQVYDVLDKHLFMLGQHLPVPRHNSQTHTKRIIC
jgi:hypothetical protein